MLEVCREKLIVEGFLVESLIDGAGIWGVDPDPIGRASTPNLVFSPKVLHALLRLLQEDNRVSLKGSLL